MYLCELCGAVFAVPHIRSWREPMPEGFSEPCRQVLCPRCFEPYFTKTPARRTDARPLLKENRTRRVNFPTGTQEKRRSYDL